MTTQPDLVAKVRRLLDTAGDDEQAAIAEFHRLVDVHGCAEVGAAVAALVPESLTVGTHDPE